MKRFTLILTCVAVIAAIGGCRCGGNLFGGQSSNNGCCGSVESISPAVTSYDPTISYDSSYGDGSSVIMAPPETVLPAPAR